VGTPHRSSLIATRASSAKKAAFAALAASRDMSESALLTVLIDTVLASNAAAVLDLPAGSCTATDRITLRLRPGDRALLDARAAARRMAPSSYLVALVRAHLRREAPLPADELATLKLTVAQLSAMLRQLRAPLVEGAPHQSSDTARALHDIAARIDDLRQQVAGVVRTHLISWESDHA